MCKMSELKEAGAEESQLRATLKGDHKFYLNLAWVSDFDSMYTLGSRIYETIFLWDPSIFGLFPKFGNYGQKNGWKECPEFRTQSLRFVQVLARSLKDLDHLESDLDPFLYRVGKLHCKYLKRGFDSDIWATFEASILSCMRDMIDGRADLVEEEKLKCLEAWRCLARYITGRIKAGFDDNLDKNPLELESDCNSDAYSTLSYSS